MRGISPFSPSLIEITLRNAQVRRISWVRGVRPAWERYEWPPHDAAPSRPPLRKRVAEFAIEKGAQPAPLVVSRLRRRYLIFDSRNSTCFFATGSYFFL